MKTAATIIAGLLAGILVAVGILAAFVFLGPEPVGLRPTPSPSPSVVVSVPPSPSPSPIPSPSPSLVPSAPSSASPSPSAAGSGGTAAFPIGEPARALSVAQLGAARST